MPKIQEISIPADVHELIVHFTERLPGNPYENPNRNAVLLANYLKTILPQEYLELIATMSRDATPSLLIIRNTPMDRIIPTGKPVEERLLEKSLVSEWVLLAFSYLLHCTIAPNPKEQKGRVIHNVSPVAEFRNTHSSLGVEPLFLHTESPQESTPPDYLMLLCLEGDPAAGTMFLDIEEFFKTLDPALIEALKKPEFNIVSGASYTGGSVENIVPLLQEEASGKHRLHCIRDNTRVIPMTETAKVAWVEFSNLLEKAETERVVTLSLSRGDAVIFNNGWGYLRPGGMMHGRKTAIQNEYRWLQRGLLREGVNTELVAKAYEASLKQLLVSKRYSVKESSGMLRQAMLRSESCMAYAKENPKATVPQITFFGTTSLKSGNFVQRISHEAVESDQRELAASRKT